MTKAISLALLLTITASAHAAQDKLNALVRSAADSYQRWEELSDFDRGTAANLNSPNVVGYAYLHYCFMENNYKSATTSIDFVTLREGVKAANSRRLEASFSQMVRELEAVFTMARGEAYCDLFLNHLNDGDPLLPKLHEFIATQAAAGENRVRLAGVERALAAASQFKDAVAEAVGLTGR